MISDGLLLRPYFGSIPPSAPGKQNSPYRFVSASSTAILCCKPRGNCCVQRTWSGSQGETWWREGGSSKGSECTIGYGGNKYKGGACVTAQNGCTPLNGGCYKRPTRNGALTSYSASHLVLKTLEAVQQINFDWQHKGWLLFWLNRWTGWT